MELSQVRQTINNHFETLRDREGPYGCYRSGKRKRPDLYSSLDIAIARTLMGEDLFRTLSVEERTGWIDTINSYADARIQTNLDASVIGVPSGKYFDTFGHSELHANGMVIGALGVLGGKQRFPVHLYDDFNSEEKVADWLDKIDWTWQWRASHLFWGGMYCYSFSKLCSNAWLARVFDWLDRNLDENTGWWRDGIPHGDRHQPLGGSVHIVPLYQHHGQTFPYPERLVDSVLALQLPNGSWMERETIHVMSYLELDALYAFSFAQIYIPEYRKDDIRQAVKRYSNLVQAYWRNHQQDLLNLHPHPILAVVGVFGLLQRLSPEDFQDEVQWSDIFNDQRLYQTAAVEVFDPQG